MTEDKRKQIEEEIKDKLDIQFYKGNKTMYEFGYEVKKNGVIKKGISSLFTFKEWVEQENKEGNK